MSELSDKLTRILVASGMESARQEALEELRALEAKLEAMERGLEEIIQWSEAYPLDVFPEPDFVKARKLLKDGGMTIDGISGIAAGDEAGEGPGELDVALGDLPYLLGMKTFGDLPPPVRIRPDGSGADVLAARLKAAGPAPLMGVTWQDGGPGGLPLADLGPALAAAGGGTIIMLQPGVGSDAAGKLAEGSGLPVVDFSDVMEDAAGALTVVSGLDVYVTVPNIGLDLRQATGGAAEVMVPWPPDFRLAGTNDASSWLPRCRLHRAAPGADWQGALLTLSHALAAGA